MYCGIDVSKNKSNVCLLDGALNTISEFEIEHNKKGFEKLDRHLEPKTKIAMEVTGNYSKVVYNHLKGYDVCYVDSVQMSNIAKYHSPTIKNDKVDAKLLAKALAFPGLRKVNPVRVDELRNLCNLYQKASKQLSRHKCMFRDQINIIFPELEKLMSNCSNLGMANMLLKYPTPRDIVNTSDEALLKAMIKDMGKGSGNFKIERAMMIKRLADQSVGDSDHPTSCLKYTLRTMVYYQHLKNEIKKSLDLALKKTPYHKLLKVFGLDTSSLSTIVGEIGDIRRFPNYKAFASYCGFGICEKRSGTSVNKSTHISKRGNSLLRSTFYTLVLVHLSYKTKISKYYNKLKERGKHPKKCMVACARKLAIKTYFEMMGCHE